MVAARDRASSWLGDGFRGRLMPAEDLADSLSRHAKTLGDRPHRDALDEAETEHFRDAVRSIKGLHLFDQTKWS